MRIVITCNTDTNAFGFCRDTTRMQRRVRYFDLTHLAIMVCLFSFSDVMDANEQKISQDVMTVSTWPKYCR